MTAGAQQCLIAQGPVFGGPFCPAGATSICPAGRSVWPSQQTECTYSFTWVNGRSASDKSPNMHFRRPRKRLEPRADFLAVKERRTWSISHEPMSLCCYVVLAWALMDGDTEGKDDSTETKIDFARRDTDLLAGRKIFDAKVHL